jgi:hypothetical protein
MKMRLASKILLIPQILRKLPKLSERIVSQENWALGHNRSGLIDLKAKNREASVFPLDHKEGSYVSAANLMMGCPLRAVNLSL